jgi:hypothetical protein
MDILTLPEGTKLSMTRTGGAIGDRVVKLSLEINDKKLKLLSGTIDGKTLDLENSQKIINNMNNVLELGGENILEETFQKKIKPKSFITDFSVVVPASTTTTTQTSEVEVVLLENLNRLATPSDGEVEYQGDENLQAPEDIVKDTSIFGEISRELKNLPPSSYDFTSKSIEEFKEKVKAFLIKEKLGASYGNILSNIDKLSKPAQQTSGTRVERLEEAKKKIEAATTAEEIEKIGKELQNNNDLIEKKYTAWITANEESMKEEVKDLVEDVKTNQEAELILTKVFMPRYIDSVISELEKEDTSTTTVKPSSAVAGIMGKVDGLKSKLTPEQIKAMKKSSEDNDSTKACDT